SRLGVGLISTIAALALGLLITSARSSYDTQSGQVQRLTSDVILLDQLLNQYGPEARPIRELMREALGPLVELLWQEGGTAGKDPPFSTTAPSRMAVAQNGNLVPPTRAPRPLKE